MKRCFVIMAMIICCATASKATVNYYVDKTDWLNAVSNVESYGTSTSELEAVIGHTPVPEESLGNVINFNSSATGLTWSFSVSTVEDGADFVYSDDNGNVYFQDILSVGNVDEHQDDDWELEITAGPSVYGIGFEVGNNDYNSGESAYVYGSDNTLLLTVTPPANQSLQFIGFVSDSDSLARIVFDEDSGHDDIGITNFMFTPEPTTLLLLGFGALALRGRKAVRS